MKQLSLTTIFGFLLIFGMSSVQARPHGHVIYKHNTVVRKIVVKPAPVIKVVNHLSGLRVSTLPRGHARIVYVGNTYYYHNGVYYVSDRDGFVVVNPAPGLREVKVIKRS